MIGEGKTQPLLFSLLTWESIAGWMVIQEVPVINLFSLKSQMTPCNVTINNVKFAVRALYISLVELYSEL